MKIARIVLVLLVALCLVSLFAGEKLRPLLDGVLPDFNALAPLGGSTDGEVEDDLQPVIHLLVLNGTDVANLAGDFSLLLDRVGCVAQRVGNAPHQNFRTSMLVNRRLDAADLTRLALALGIRETMEEADPRADEDAVLLLGADYQAVLDRLHGNEGQR
jgi:LytR cell envelope-related transcriptional attenuator